MASMQRERNKEITMQPSREKKASLDEIIKQAKCSLESQELMNQSRAVVAKNDCLDKAAAARIQVTILSGALQNFTKGSLTRKDYHKYAGHFVENFPYQLDSCYYSCYYSGTFVMAAITDKGVMAAVVYSGKNKAGDKCEWLLGFAATEGTGKVYVECGRESKFDNIDWEKVRTEIIKGKQEAEYTDPEAGTAVEAKIVNFGGNTFGVATGFFD